MAWHLFGILALIILTGCAQAVAPGDQVQVNYVGTFQNGTVFDQGTLMVAAGRGQVIKGFDRALIGMREGETKTVTIPAGEAYGGYDPEKVARVPPAISMSRRTEVNRTIVVPAGEVPNATIGNTVRTTHFVYEVTAANATHAMLYIANVTDETVQLPGTFWQSILVATTPETIVYEHNITDGAQITTPLGPYVAEVNATHLVLRTPFDVGEEVRVPQGVGRVTSRTPDAVHIDFNHPLAGHDLTFEITVTGVLR